MDGWMYVRTYLDSRDTGGNSLDETPVVRDLLLTSVISDPNATALLIWKWCKKSVRTRVFHAVLSTQNVHDETKNSGQRGGEETKKEERD